MQEAAAGAARTGGQSAQRAGWVSSRHWQGRGARGGGPTALSRRRGPAPRGRARRRGGSSLVGGWVARAEGGAGAPGEGAGRLPYGAGPRRGRPGSVWGGGGRVAAARAWAHARPAPRRGRGSLDKVRQWSKRGPARRAIERGAGAPGMCQGPGRGGAPARPRCGETKLCTQARRRGGGETGRPPRLGIKGRGVIPEGRARRAEGDGSSKGGVRRRRPPRTRRQRPSAAERPGQLDSGAGPLTGRRQASPRRRS
jgi:hypothetical protein